MSEHQTCPLCFSAAKKIEDDKYYLCPKCKAVFLNKELYLSSEGEKKIYKRHNNDIYDDRYRNFVSPITSEVLKKENTNTIGLDFGAGTGPVISAVLEEKGYNVLQYDPFFFNDKELLEKEYDYIVCCEVVEHFKDPRKEFELLKKLLKPGGSLYLMTNMYRAGLDFKNWRYRQDPTHIFIYSKETFEYIHKEFKFKSLSISGRLIIFKK